MYKITNQYTDNKFWHQIILVFVKEGNAEIAFEKNTNKCQMNRIT